MKNFFFFMLVFMACISTQTSFAQTGDMPSPPMTVMSMGIKTSKSVLNSLPKGLASDIKAVEPFLRQAGNGFLSIDAAEAKDRNLTPTARRLVSSSIEVVNAMVASGQFVLRADGSLLQVGGSRALLSGSEYFRHYWWGYEAGINNWRTKWLRNALQSSSGATISLVIGGVIPAAPAVAAFIVFRLVYLRRIEAVDRGRGIKFVASWPGLATPFVYSQ